MTDEPPGGWLESIEQGLNIPGAVKAIKRLIGSGAGAIVAGIDIGTAKLKQRSAQIRAETAAKVEIIKSVGIAAAERAASDPGLVDRAVEAWFDDRLRQQENREAVATKTATLLLEGPSPADPNSDGPNDDWMNVFSRHAAEASSERLRETWAQIFAGEIRQPGSFSLATLSFISILDRELAAHVSWVLQYVMDGSMVPNHRQIQ